MSSDARLLELEFLSRLSRFAQTEVSINSNIPFRDMIVHLLVEGMVNDVAGLRLWSNNIEEMTHHVMRVAEYERNRALVFFLDNQKISVRISHKGRVRLAELEQAIKAGREREPFGILLGARYWERDLSIALLSASTDAPVALCFLDMNGLKAINDERGHEVGNEAIRAFLRVVAANVEEVGDAYRYGGDEVVVILPGTNADAAEKRMVALLKQLGGEKIDGVETLTASCGIGIAANPDLPSKRFSEAVDAVQYRAKAASKEGPKRQSVLALEGGKVVVV